jgi:hypothetical protein
MVIGATMSLMAFDAPKRMGFDGVDKKSPSRNRVIDPLRPWQHADGRVEYQREFFESWDEWRIAQGSDFDHRCGTPSPPPGSTGGVAGFAGSDCDLQQTVPSDEYDPAHGDLVIPVVVHVIQNDEGTLGWIDRPSSSRFEFSTTTFPGLEYPAPMTLPAPECALHLPAWTRTAEQRSASPGHRTRPGSTIRGSTGPNSRGIRRDT